MAYNNGFPMNYPYYAQNGNLSPNFANFSQNQPVNAQQNGIIWVQGEAGAKSYLVAPNTTVQLWDSEDQVIYLKSADASGMPSMKVLDYKIREMGAQGTSQALSASNSADYVTKEELQAFEEKFQNQLNRLSQSRSKKEVKEDE